VVWSTATRADHLLEGTVNGAGSALDWLATREGTDLAGLLAAAEADRAAAPPLFMNAVSGLGSPFWAGSLTPHFIGDGSRGARVRAVLESIAFLVQANLEEMAPHGPPLSRMLLTGGLSANAYLCGCLAALSGLPLARATDPEATARGLARLLAGPDAAHWPAPPLEAPPVPDVAGVRGRYRAWRQALARLLAPAGELVPPAGGAHTPAGPPR
jgi:glycerol kinase